MSSTEGMPLELQNAWDNAWSARGEGTPPGVYIGSVTTEYTTYYFYKEGLNYWYENNYDREMRAKQKAKKKRERNQRRNGYGRYYGRR